MNNEKNESNLLELIDLGLFTYKELQYVTEKKERNPCELCNYEIPSRAILNCGSIICTMCLDNLYDSYVIADLNILFICPCHEQKITDIKYEL